ncbi:MAG: type II secretion system protein N [Telluria sp.]
MKRLPLLLTLLALVVLSASVAYWVLQLYKPQQRPLAAAPMAVVPEPAVDAAATLFGGEAIAVMAANYQLTGVVSAGSASVAILVADGQPPKALPIGKEIAPGVTVKEVHARYVMLSEGGVLKRIELATDAKPAAEMAAPMQAAPPPQQPEQPPQSQPQLQQEQSMPVQPGQEPPPPAPPVQMPPVTRNLGADSPSPTM